VSPFSNIAVLVAIYVKKYAVAALDGLISALFARLDYSGKTLKAPRLNKEAHLLFCSNRELNWSFDEDVWSLFYRIGRSTTH
jgi:hypothetical protein